MSTEFGGKFLPGIRVELEDSSYRRVLRVGFELFIVVRGYLGVRKLRLKALKNLTHCLVQFRSEV